MPLTLIYLSLCLLLFSLLWQWGDHYYACHNHGVGAVVEWVSSYVSAFMYALAYMYQRDVPPCAWSYKTHYLVTHLRQQCAGSSGPHGFSRITPHPSSFYYRSLSMQMSTAKAINATWAAPEGTAGAPSCKSLIKQLCDEWKRITQ